MSVKYFNTGGGWSPFNILGSVLSLAVPGAAPWIAGASALNSAVRGDLGGALTNGLSAASGFGGNKAATGSAASDTRNLTSQMDSDPLFLQKSLSDLNPSINKTVSPNNAPVLRSAGMSPDTPYADVSSLAKQQAEDLSKNKYNSLLSMYGITPTGQGAFNHDAAKDYYRNFAIGDNPLDTEDNPSIYNSLMRMIGRR